MFSVQKNIKFFFFLTTIKKKNAKSNKFNIFHSMRCNSMYIVRKMKNIEGAWVFVSQCNMIDIHFCIHSKFLNLLTSKITPMMDQTPILFIKQN